MCFFHRKCSIILFKICEEDFNFDQKTNDYNLCKFPHITQNSTPWIYLAINGRVLWRKGTDLLLFMLGALRTSCPNPKLIFFHFSSSMLTCLQNFDEIICFVFYLLKKHLANSDIFQGFPSDFTIVNAIEFSDPQNPLVPTFS